MLPGTVVLSKKFKQPCQELFLFLYKKFLSIGFITTVGHEVADCGEWLHFILI